MHTKFWLKSLKGKDHTEDLGVDGRIPLEWILKKQNGRAWTGFIWLRIGANGVLFLTS
jgi:hypothetical protein